jgi:hypothetical protein
MIDYKKMNNCRIQVKEVEGESVCIVDALKFGEGLEVTLHLNPQDLINVQRLIKFINDNPQTNI